LSQARNPGERALGRGSAKPIACDATGGSDLDAAVGSGTLERRGRRHRAAPDAWADEPGGVAAA